MQPAYEASQTHSPQLTPTQLATAGSDKGAEERELRLVLALTTVVAFPHSVAWQLECVENGYSVPELRDHRLRPPDLAGFSTSQVNGGETRFA